MRKIGLIAGIVGFGVLGVDLLLRWLTNFSSWLWLPGFLALAAGGAVFVWLRAAPVSPVIPAPKASPAVNTATGRGAHPAQATPSATALVRTPAARAAATPLPTLKGAGPPATAPILAAAGAPTPAAAAAPVLAAAAAPIPTRATAAPVLAVAGAPRPAAAAAPVLAAAAAPIPARATAAPVLAAAGAPTPAAAGAPVLAAAAAPIPARAAAAGAATPLPTLKSPGAAAAPILAAAATPLPARVAAAAAAATPLPTLKSPGAAAAPVLAATATPLPARVAVATPIPARAAAAAAAVTPLPTLKSPGAESSAPIPAVAAAVATIRIPAAAATGAPMGRAADSHAKGQPVQSLGRYQLEREIGRGAMGTVYLGRDTAINRQVAIKAIPLAIEFSDAELADARTRFFREAETAGRLNHPNIVTIYDVGEERGLAYIAMEYLKGRHLSDYAKSNNLLEPRKVLELVARTANALGFAHKQQVVHRDIKPANLMYDPGSDVLKITDFGIARLTGSGATRTGIVLGTPSFMSPEQLEGRTVTGQSDLFSLGVSLFQLLTGRLPFAADSMTGLMQQIAEVPHPPLRAFRPDLPLCVDDIIDRALAKSPDSRFDSGAQMAAILEDCRSRIPSGLP